MISPSKRWRSSSDMTTQNFHQVGSLLPSVLLSPLSVPLSDHLVFKSKESKIKGVGKSEGEALQNENTGVKCRLFVVRRREGGERGGENICFRNEAS